MNPILTLIIGVIMFVVGCYCWWYWFEAIQKSPDHEKQKPRPTTLNEFYARKLLEPIPDPLKKKITGCEYCRQMRDKQKKEARNKEGRRRGESLSRRYN